MVRIIRPGRRRISRGRVKKPFTHMSAKYRSPGDDEYNHRHERCKSCAHYDNNGSCFIVPDIEPEGYCEEYYADVIIAGHKHGETVEENLILLGEQFNWDDRDIEEFTLDIAEMLERQHRGD